MIKDIIEYNEKKYQLSTVNIDGYFETMIFPIENGVILGSEVYAWRTYNAGESHDKHRDILNRFEKYLSEESIAEYLRLKEEDFEDEEEIPFPFQYMEQYFLGEISFDGAVDKTIDEVHRLIGEYVGKHTLKT